MNGVNSIVNITNRPNILNRMKLNILILLEVYELCSFKLDKVLTEAYKTTQGFHN